jgi:hypothetical protein
MKIGPKLLRHCCAASLWNACTLFLQPASMLRKMLAAAPDVHALPVAAADACVPACLPVTARWSNSNQQTMA